jgi:phosphoribosylamine--glycine ligase
VRILGIGDYNDFGSLYLRLRSEGHEVRVHVAEAGSRDVMDGLVEQVPAWEPALDWLGRDGLVIVEDSGRGAVQDRLRRDGYRVLGGGELGDRLEQDRAFGQSVLRDCGMAVAPSHAFDSFADGSRWLAHHPGRYVLKFDGSFLPSEASYVGMRDDGGDVAALLRHHARRWHYAEPPRFILMDHLRGIETGVGAFFNGTAFVGPINLDWEHKRLFPGDLGELTGEMGTVVTYERGERLFDATLARLAPLLREAGHVGYVNLNTIINDRGVWPLELTCRFGYPGFAILSALFAEPCGDILWRIASGSSEAFATHGGFAVGVVLTVPPFPYHHGYDELGKDLPIAIPDDLSDDDRRHLHYGEVRVGDAGLVTAGQIGYVMVVTGRSATIDQAQQRAYALARRIAIPTVRYRIDIGDSLRDRDLAELHRLGWW